MKRRGSSPSATAAVVASTQLVLEHHPRLGSLVDRRSSALIRRALASIYPQVAPIFEPSHTRRLLPLALLVERVLSPGFITYYALRKKAIRAELARAIADGFRQVVLVGAGLDMLSASLPDRDLLTIFEVDHPTTQNAKLEALAGDPSLDAITSICVDLASTSLDSALRGSKSFKRDADTVFVAEGVFMYLAPNRVEAAFESMHRACRARSRAIFSVVGPDARGRVRIHSQSRAVDLCMRWLDEPFNWGLGPEQLERFLSSLKWSLDRAHTTADLRAQFLNSIDASRIPDTGETIVVATAKRLEPGIRVLKRHGVS